MDDESTSGKALQELSVSRESNLGMVGKVGIAFSLDGSTLNLNCRMPRVKLEKVRLNRSRSDRSYLSWVSFGQRKVKA